MSDTVAGRLPRASTRLGLPAAVTRWLSGWILAGLVCSALVLGLLDSSTGRIAEAGGPLAVVVLVVVGVALQLAAVEVSRSRSSHIVSLIEIAVVAALLLTNGYWGWVVVVATVAIVQPLQPKAWIKAVFNVSQAAVAGAVAAFAYDLLAPATPQIGWGHVGAVTLAVLLFGMTNWFAVMGVLTRLEGRSVWSRSPQTRTLSSFSTMGNIAIGVVTAILWHARPDMAILAVVPVLSVYLAYRGIAATRASLEREQAHADRLGRVLDAAEEGVIALDERGRIELWSPAIARLTGIAPADAAGATLGELLQPLDAAGEPLDTSVFTRVRGSGVTIDWRLPDVDGSMRDLSVSVSPLQLEGDRQGTVLLLRDLTRQREVERLKDDFLMRVSHELRTPLTPIQGFAESLRVYRDLMTPEQVETALESILGRARELTQMVDDLLLVATPGSSHASRPTPVDVDRLLNDLVAKALRGQPGRTVTVKVDDRNERLFGGTTSMPRLDVAGVTRVLEILLDNALRYSAVDTAIHIVATITADELEVTVADQGRGIPRDQLESIFDRFHRLEDPMVMTTRGVGVGLYIARRLARLAGGDVTVESQLGRGSVFTLRVPVADGLEQLRQVSPGTAGRPPAA